MSGSQRLVDRMCFSRRTRCG
ncbi:hypothetical protein LINPERHAP2_LOCUS42850 [Linum perenne]